MRLRPAGLAAALATALLLSLAGPPAQAGDDARHKRDLDTKIGQAQVDLDEVSATYLAAAKRLADLQARLPAARAALAAARGQLAAAQAREAALSEQLRVAEAQVSTAEAQLAGVRASIATSERQLGQLARSAYQDGASASLTVYLDAGSIDDVMRRLGYTQSAAESQDALLGRLSDSRADLAARTATLQARRDQVAGLRTDAAGQVTRRAQFAGAALVAQQQLDALVGQANDAARAIAAEKARELAKIAAMEAESRRIGAILAQRAAAARARAAAQARAEAAAQAAARASARRQHRSYRAPVVHRTATRSSGFLSRPTDGYISSPFGMRVHPVTGVYKLHDGVDFASPCGTPIHAAADGVVVEAAYEGAWGNRVILDHGLVGGHGMATGYNHMTRSIVSVGQQVARHQVIGFVGTTGLSTGCHLHFHLFRDGVPVDAMPYF